MCMCGGCRGGVGGPFPGGQAKEAWRGRYGPVSAQRRPPGDVLPRLVAGATPEPGGWSVLRNDVPAWRDLEGPGDPGEFHRR